MAGSFQEHEMFPQDEHRAGDLLDAELILAGSRVVSEAKDTSPCLRELDGEVSHIPT
jgi:hypothetical protein